MENKKTISWLNSKVWYRFLKVVFICSILFCLLIGNASLLSNGVKRLDNGKTLISCKTTSNKNTYTPNELEIKLTASNFTQDGEFIDPKSKIWKTCGGGFDPSSSFANSLNLFDKYVILPNLVFDINPVYTYKEFILKFIINNLLVILFFEILRRAFYYIILGKIRPEK